MRQNLQPKFALTLSAIARSVAPLHDDEHRHRVFCTPQDIVYEK